jgi:hypothetical protein
MEAIRKRHGSGLSLTGVGVRTGEGADWSLYGAADRLFGSWAEAVRAAVPGFPVQVRRRNVAADAAEADQPKAAVPGAAREPPIPKAKPPPPPEVKPGDSPSSLEDLIRNMGLGD